MSRFAVPKIVRPLDLAQYAPEVAAAASDQPIRVWVNPPRAMLARWDSLVEQFSALSTRAKEAPEVWSEPEAKTTAGEFFAWWAEIWSQGAEGTQWTAQDVEAFKDECLESDPRLWEFVTSETWRMIVEHRKAARKN